MNWLSLVAAAVSALFVGFVWYNPKVFGKAWMETLGLTEEDLSGGNMAVIFLIAFIMAGFLAVGLTVIVIHPDQPEEFYTFKHGALHGALTGIFLAMPILVTNALFERRNWKYMLINTGYWIATMAIMGGIISAMGTA